MKINQVTESTTSGSVATVAQPIGETQRRTPEYGSQKVGQLKTGKVKQKKEYANSITEAAIKEEEINEEDLVVSPDKGSRTKTGLHGKNRKALALDIYRAPFRANGIWVSDSRGTSVLEVVKHGTLAKEVADALNAYVATKESVGSGGTGGGVIAGGGVGESNKMNENKNPQIGVANLKSIIKAVEAGTEANIRFGNDIITLNVNEARALNKVYRNAINEGKHESIAKVMSDPMKFYKLVKSLNEDFDELSPANLLNMPGAAKGLAARNRERMRQEKQAQKAMFAPPPKEKKPEINLGAIARMIQDTAGETFPDSDPIDYLAPRLERMGIPSHKISSVLDMAAKKHLGSKSYHDYLADMWDDFFADQPEMADQWGINANQNPWRTNESMMEDLPQAGTQYDARATQQYAQKIQRALQNATSANVNDIQNQDGSITLVVNPSVQNPSIGSVVGGTEGATAKNISTAIDPFYRMFRQKGWRFDQPSQGRVTFAVPVQQGVAEGLPGSSQIYDQIESLREKLNNTSDPDERRFYIKKIKNLEHKLHSTDDPFDIDDPAPIGRQGVAEGAKVDRMVKHIKQSEIKTGKSADKAEDIAWATANKRGMLDNKNKKGE